jgi:alpha-1,3-rhamnosyl/mannosyltransferase
MASGRKTGVGHYTAQLIRGLNAHRQEVDVDVFPGPWVQKVRRTWTRLRSTVARRTNSRQAAPSDRNSSRLRHKLLGTLRSLGQSGMAFHFRSKCQAGHYDLYHETNYIPLPCDLPTVTTIYDLSVLLHPEWHPADRVRFYEQNFGRSLAQCQHVLAISETCRREVIQELDFPADRVTRTYLGIRSVFRQLAESVYRPILQQLGLPKRYLFYIGTIEPRKNILHLLQAYCALPAGVRDSCPLILAGGWGWNSEAVADFYYREARHRGVRLIGYIRERHLAALYNGAQALVYPSYYEGFGLPPLEMMACGGAVLGSTAEALRETVGRQAHLIDPDDVAGWRDAMARVMTDPDWRLKLCQDAPEVAKPYTWQRCAAETLQAYQNMLQATPSSPSHSWRAAG